MWKRWSSSNHLKSRFPIQTLAKTACLYSLLDKINEDLTKDLTCKNDLKCKTTKPNIQK